MAAIPPTLYHYTSKFLARQIESDGCIRPTEDGSSHARFGSGVYLLDIHPSSSDKEIRTAGWGGQVNPEKVCLCTQVVLRTLQASFVLWSQ